MIKTNENGTLSLEIKNYEEHIGFFGNDDKLVEEFDEMVDKKEEMEIDIINLKQQIRDKEYAIWHIEHKLESSMFKPLLIENEGE